MTEVLSVRDLRVEYRSRRGGTTHPAVRGVDLSVQAGQVVALVGESGSGKSTIAGAVTALLPASAAVTSGIITLEGEDITGMSAKRATSIRGARIGMVPQDPGVALNPLQRIGNQVAEILTIHRLADRRRAALDAIDILERVGLDDPAERARQYPHELSGGMRQRVLIGIALACRPTLVIADEPTSALDVTVQRAILDLFDELTTEAGAAVLLITHDLGVAAERCDQIIVLSDGEVVEHGTAEDVLTRPQHGYTKRLIAAAPSVSTIDTATRRERSSAKGVPDDEAPDTRTPVVEVHGLVKEYVRRGNSGREPFLAVDGVSFTIPRGRTFALVGESGSGKSTTGRMVARLVDPTSGSITIDGAEATTLRGTALRTFRSTVQIVYQNPYASLDPRHSIARIISEPLRAFRRGDRAARRRRTLELLDHVALDRSMASRRPSELSGGQRQRVAIARAIALEPSLIVLDEPVSALDVSVQAQILQLLVDLQVELGMSYLFISHDLAVVRRISDTVGVMRSGRLVETGRVADVFESPQDEYTVRLLDSIPRPAWTNRELD
jgi:peptide/nickel transport system ATP-binding protein